MTVLLEAEDSERDGTAYFPYERRWNKRRLPVRVVDRKWIREHLQELKVMLGRTENARLKALLQLKDALDGKSSGLENIAAAVVGWSAAVQRSAASMDNDLKKYGRNVLAKDGRFLGRVADMPVGPDEAAWSFLLDLKPDPRSLFAAEVTVGLSQTIPCLWIDRKQRLQFGLYCPDFRSAIYATAVGGEGIACCLRCGGFFLRARKDKQFCSDKCQNTWLRARRRKEIRVRMQRRKSSSRKGK